MLVNHWKILDYYPIIDIYYPIVDEYWDIIGKTIGI
jgi:hypothetical protein